MVLPFRYTIVFGNFLFAEDAFVADIGKFCRWNSEVKGSEVGPFQRKASGEITGQGGAKGRVQGFNHPSAVVNCIVVTIHDPWGEGGIDRKIQLFMDPYIEADIQGIVVGLDFGKAVDVALQPDVVKEGPGEVKEAVAGEGKFIF